MLTLFLLVRFNRTQEIFPSVTEVLSIFLTTAATNARPESVNACYKSSMWNSSCQLCTEVSSLQQ